MKSSWIEDRNRRPGLRNALEKKIHFILAEIFCFLFVFTSDYKQYSRKTVTDIVTKILSKEKTTGLNKRNHVCMHMCESTVCFCEYG